MGSSVSDPILANGMNFNLPAGATVLGVATSFSASALGTGTPSINIQLASNGSAVGFLVNVPINGTTAVYNQGSPNYQWGTVLSPSLINGSSFGILLQAELDTSGTSAVSADFSLNQLEVTVYYTTSTTSEVLQVTAFAFVVPSTAGVSGVGVTFEAYTSTNTTATLQLLKAGVPVGTPKLVTLTTTPTIYSLGVPSDLWGSTWVSSDINNPSFGVQITADGIGTTFARDLDMLVYLTPALENFNYIKTYEQNNGQLTTLALDAAGIVWKEDVLGNPGVLSVALTGILPGSFAQSQTNSNKEFIMFSDLSIGTERPRLLDTDGKFYPVTQVGPGAPPSFQAATGSVGGIITISSFAISSNVLIVQYTGPTPSADAVYVLSVPSISYLDGQSVIILSSGLSLIQFKAQFNHADVASTNAAGTATPSFNYGITSIIQHPANPSGTVNDMLWSAAPGSAQPGNTITVYYAQVGVQQKDTQLVNDFGSGNAVFVQITNAPFGNGIWQVTSVGQATPPGAGAQRYYFTFTYNQVGYQHTGGNAAAHAVRYQETIATMTVSTPIPALSAGSPITITGVTPTNWNGTWIIVEPLNSGSYNITSTGYVQSTGTATYGWSAIIPSPPPTAGDLITIIGCTNSAIFNGTFVIATVSGPNFTVTGISAPADVATQTETQGQAVEFGTKFTFDPGASFQGTTTNTIYGSGSGGNVALIGSSLGASIVPIGAGTRQAICFFITESGNWTPVSPPATFTVFSNANELLVSNIPIGPPNVVARGIAITEAGANGVPGANFYVITKPVTQTVGTVTTTYTSTIIQNNTDTTASFSFTDAVLLNSMEVDVQGNNLFNLIEIGSCGWCLPYASRMFYGLQLNKVQNFNNLTFDGGSKLEGWGQYPTANEISLLVSPVTGMALYIHNTTGSTQAVMGTLSQTAYQDPYGVGIILPNTLYSVRVACSCPSGIQLGSLVLDLVDLNNGNFGNVYGTFTLPLTSMTSNTAVFSGTLLTDVLNPVSPFMQFRIRVTNMGPGADVEIDRIEVFPTKYPYLKAQVYGSYINKPEEVDASGDGGIIDTTTENAQWCMGGFVLRDKMYLLKTTSMYFTTDNPNSEPGGWSLSEVSNRVGAIGIHSYHTGEEWATMACRSGIYGFDGGEPKLLNLEIMPLWDAINWDAGNTIVLRNDIVNRRLLCAIPLPTGPGTKSLKWLPYAAANPAPTTPNVMLMLNYNAMGSFNEMVSAIACHSTMFGTLANPDMRRKWSIWQIPSPAMDFITRQNYNDQPLFICNGIDSSKIYRLDPDIHDDDGVAISSLYATYGFVSATKAMTIPIFGLHQKRYTVFQCTAEGSGLMTTKMYPNTLDARYPYTVPIGIKLNEPVMDDYFRPINVKGNRMFVEVSTNALGDWFQLHKLLLTGKGDPWSTLPATGGGNAGIV